MSIDRIRSAEDPRMVRLWNWETKSYLHFSGQGKTTGVTLDDYRGVRVIFSWEAEGCANDDFAKTIRNAVENAVDGAKAQ